MWEINKYSQYTKSFFSKKLQNKKINKKPLHLYFYFITYIDNNIKITIINFQVHKNEYIAKSLFIITLNEVPEL